MGGGRAVLRRTSLREELHLHLHWHLAHTRLHGAHAGHGHTVLPGRWTRRDLTQLRHRGVLRLREVRG